MPLFCYCHANVNASNSLLWILTILIFFVNMIACVFIKGSVIWEDQMLKKTFLDRNDQNVFSHNLVSVKKSCSRNKARAVLSKNTENECSRFLLSITHPPRCDWSRLLFQDLYNMFILFFTALQRNRAVLQNNKSHPVWQRWILYDWLW